MKYTDPPIPVPISGQLRSLEMSLRYFKSMMNANDPALALAFAQLQFEFRNRMDALKRTGSADKREAAAAAGALV